MLTELYNKHSILNVNKYKKKYWHTFSYLYGHYLVMNQWTNWLLTWSWHEMRSQMITKVILIDPERNMNIWITFHHSLFILVEKCLNLDQNDGPADSESRVLSTCATLFPDFCCSFEKNFLKWWRACTGMFHFYHWLFSTTLTAITAPFKQASLPQKLITV